MTIISKKENKLQFGIMLALIALVGAPGLTTPTYAAPGDSLLTINPPQCTDGIGVAFDGSRIIYTCRDNTGQDSIPTLFYTDTTAADLGSQSVVDGTGAPVGVDAIAWDSNENRLWGGDLDKVNNLCDIYSIDLSVTPAVATKRFSFSQNGCQFSFYDGITVDTVSNTLYLNPDVQKDVRHMDKLGNPLADDPIDMQALIGFSSISGLAIGIDQNLYVGTNGAGKIFQVDPFTPASLGQFATFAGRDEDMECGPLVNNQETLLVRGLNINIIDVLEVAPQTCVLPNMAVGGELLPINTTALLIAGLQTGMFWIAPVIAGAAGTTALYLKTRKN